MSDASRYARQTILDEIGQAGQDKLSAASVLCIGAGGLGCPALLYMAAAGLGRIGIIDFDRVEESNLQRQTLYSTEQIGENKASAAKARLSALNPTITIEAYEQQLNADNAQELFEQYDLIIDGTDNFAAKYLINDMAVKCGKPFIYGALQGFTGQLAVFNASDNAPCYRCLYPKPPKEHIPTCAEGGVIGAVAGMIGTAQAMEAIKLIVDNTALKPLSGRLLCMDMRDMRTTTLNIPKNETCPACAADPQDIQITPTQELCTMIEQITPDQLSSFENAIIIDVREKEEWDAGFIEGARHLPLSILMENPETDLPRDKDIILYCAKGMRSQYAAEMLRAQGYENLKNMAGGYDGWRLMQP